MFTDQRSPAGLVQIIYICYTIFHNGHLPQRITIENIKLVAVVQLCASGKLQQCGDNDDDDGVRLSWHACSTDDPRSKVVGMQCSSLLSPSRGLPIHNIL